MKLPRCVLATLAMVGLSLAQTACDPPPPQVPPGGSSDQRAEPQPTAPPTGESSGTGDTSDQAAPSGGGADGAEGETGATAGGAADGAACDSGADCASGMCEGEGCGPMEGVCASLARPCTRDLRAYCGCDGQTFRGSGTCPGARFAYRGECRQ